MKPSKYDPAAEVARPGCEGGEGGHAVGRDPRAMTRAELEAIGHQPMSPLAALRLRCLDCCAGSPAEVRHCTAVKCPSWPFRMGASPWRAPLSEEQRQAKQELGRRNAAHLRAAVSDTANNAGSDAESPPAATPVADDDPSAEKPAGIAPDAKAGA